MAKELDEKIGIVLTDAERAEIWNLVNEWKPTGKMTRDRATSFKLRFLPNGDRARTFAEIGRILGVSSVQVNHDINYMCRIARIRVAHLRHPRDD